MLEATIQWYVAANERRAHIYFNRFIASEELRARLSFTKNPIARPGDEVARATLNLQPLLANGLTECDIALFCDFLRLYANYGFNNEFRRHFQFREDEVLPIILYVDPKNGLSARCRDSCVSQREHHLSSRAEAGLIIDLERTAAGKNLILQVLGACPNPNDPRVLGLLSGR